MAGSASHAPAPGDPPEREEPPGAGATPAARRRARRRRPSTRRLVLEWVVIAVAAVLVAFLVKTFAVEAFFIPSGSMEPTLDLYDRVLVNKLSYDFHAVHRGDIVVFTKPPRDTSPGTSDLIKRVIGLPGETIQSGPDGAILIDGKPIAQPWLTRSARASPGPPIARQVIPSGEYFVMGDNRGDSFDSRYFGPIPRRLIVGRAFARIWPLSRLAWF